MSADLDELGRTQVLVVCGGVKSILDVPKTLEALETRGVAVAALEASANGFAKVAVVDFDVHHGNGTEDILSGDDRFFFASVHAFGGGTYPGTGGARSKTAENVLNVPLPPPIKKSGFRRAVEKIARRVKAFGPDLLLLSAGFDGHRDDLADLGRLDEDDYGRCTRMLLASCGCPCVSILEGGYGRDCEDDDGGVAREPGAGLAAAIDDQRLRSFDACLEAHLDACADHFHGAGATPPTPARRPPSRGRRAQRSGRPAATA